MPSDWVYMAWISFFQLVHMRIGTSLYSLEQTQNTLVLMLHEYIKEDAIITSFVPMGDMKIGIAPFFETIVISGIVASHAFEHDGNESHPLRTSMMA